MRFKDVFDRIQMHDLCSIFFFRSNCLLRLWNTVLLAGNFLQNFMIASKAFMAGITFTISLFYQDNLFVYI